MARPTKLNAEVTRKVCEAVKLGATYADAAGYAGIAYRTFADWMASEEPQFQQFSQSVKDAQAAGKIGLLAKIEKAINDGHWQAAAWKLERRDPEYARRDRMELTGKDGGSVQVQASVVVLPGKLSVTDWVAQVNAAVSSDGDK